MSHWGQLCGRQRKLRTEKCCSVCLIVMVMYSLNCHLSDRFFSTPSISHSLPAFYSLCIAARKLQKYLWVVILVIYLKHLLLYYDMLFIAVIHPSVLIMPIFQSLIAFCDLDSKNFLPSFFFSFTTKLRILILAFID